jgi:hypothetical protein
LSEQCSIYLTICLGFPDLSDMCYILLTILSPCAQTFPEKAGDGPTLPPILQPGIVAVTTTAAATSSASFPPIRPPRAVVIVFRYCAGSK